MLIRLAMAGQRELTYDEEKCHLQGSGIKYTAREKDFLYHLHGNLPLLGKKGLPWKLCRLVGCRVKVTWPGRFSVVLSSLEGIFKTKQPGRFCAGAGSAGGGGPWFLRNRRLFSDDPTRGPHGNSSGSAASPRSACGVGPWRSVS